MPPVTIPWAQINGTLPPLIPDPAKQAPPPVFDDPLPQDQGTAPLSALPAPKPQSAVWAPVDAGKPIPKAAMGTIAANADPLGAEQQQITGKLQKLRDKDAQEAGPHHGWGEVGHVLGGIANTAGNIFAPGITANIPGSDLNRRVQEFGLEKSLRELMGEQSKEGLEGAQAGNQAAEAGEHAVNATLAPEKAKSEENLQSAQASEVPSEIEKNKAEIYGLQNPWAKLPGNEPVDHIDQINKGMTDLYQAHHPGSATPEEFQLPSNATKNDLDRLDKLLTAEGTAASTQAQRDETNQMRQAMYQLALQNHEQMTQARQDTEDAKSRKWAMGTDASGNSVAGPVSELEAQGIKNLADVPTNEIAMINDARQVVRLSTKQGDPNHPETMGVEQLIQSLGKDGKLGVAASRLNSWLSGGVGAEPGDDPRIMALLDKSDLMMTKTMKAHFGASGGRSPQMLEHFLQMANARKMNANTLAAGVRAVTDYMKDQAMESGGGQLGADAGAPKDGTTKTNSSGDKIVFRGGKWGPG